MSDGPRPRGPVPDPSRRATHGLSDLRSRSLSGYGSPEGKVAAGKGVTWQDTDPDGSGAIYKKTTSSGNVGWVELGTGTGAGGLTYARFRHLAGSASMTLVLGEFFVDWTLWEPAGVVTGDGYDVIDYDTGSGTVTAIQTPGPGLYHVSWQGASYINPTGSATDEEIQLRVSIFPTVTTDQPYFDNIVHTINADDWYSFTHSGLIWVPDDAHYIATAASDAGPLGITDMVALQTHYLNIAKVGIGV